MEWVLIGFLAVLSLGYLGLVGHVLEVNQRLREQERLNTWLIWSLHECLPYVEVVAEDEKNPLHRVAMALSQRLKEALPKERK